MDLDGPPRDLFVFESRWKNTLGGVDRQPHCGGQELPHGNCLEVQKVEPRMTLCEPCHARHG